MPQGFSANMAVAQMHRGDFASAAFLCRMALERSPGLADVRFNLARSLELLGRRDEAVGEYRRVLDGCPSHGPARAALSRLGAYPGEAPARPL